MRCEEGIWVEDNTTILGDVRTCQRVGAVLLARPVFTREQQTLANALHGYGKATQ